MILLRRPFLEAPGAPLNSNTALGRSGCHTCASGVCAILLLPAGSLRFDLSLIFDNSTQVINNVVGSDGLIGPMSKLAVL